MMTAIDRLRKADELMPCVKLRVVPQIETVQQTPEGIKAVVDIYRESFGIVDPCSATLTPGYELKGREQPSCSMVLRCAYGVKSCRYDDQAPDGERLLRLAREAYCDAAKLVPARERASRMDRLQTRLDRLLGSE